jgi:hypothetical protein
VPVGSVEIKYLSNSWVFNADLRNNSQRQVIVVGVKCVKCQMSNVEIIQFLFYFICIMHIVKTQQYA